MTPPGDCILCRGEDGDAELDVVEVWSDDLWRFTLARHGPTLGFGYLEPIRHIPFLADFDGEEALTFGPVVARASAALREATGARHVYGYLFGSGVPHLHLHLAPNIPEGVLNTSLITGEVVERKLPSGATEVVSKDHPDLPAEDLEAVIQRTRELMAR